jgi:hypothetical protein
MIPGKEWPGAQMAAMESGTTEVYNQVLPDPTDLNSPEDLERRRLQNWAEEQVADQEDPAMPEEDEYIARCMRLWSAKPESRPETNPRKRAYEDISDASNQDGRSVGGPEFPAGDEAADYVFDEVDRIDQDKPTQ